MANNNDWEGLLTLLSFMIGLENWSLNKQQMHNKELLNHIISQNDEIIRLLKEK